MPSRALLDEFIAVVESGDHAGAIIRVYLIESAHAGTLHRTDASTPPEMWEIAGSGFRRAGIVKEPLAKDLVAAPLLHGDLVDAMHSA